jgi:hypothetical protein
MKQPPNNPAGADWYEILVVSQKYLHPLSRNVRRHYYYIVAP